jgi:molecular chaperone GrpE
MRPTDDTPLELNDQPADDAADLTAEAPAAESGDAASRELAEQRDKYLRLAAEYDNYRRRSMRERSEAEARGQAGLIKQLLDPLDDLSRFAHLDPATVDPTTIVHGVDMVDRKLQKVLAGAGVEIIDPVDAQFDPAVHEAVSTEPAKSEAEDHMVSRVFQIGYRHGGQLIRPARVVVKQWNG